MSAFNPYFALLDNIVFLIGVKGFALRKHALGSHRQLAHRWAWSVKFSMVQQFDRKISLILSQFRRIILGGKQKKS
jgi:hypothetical protein